MENTYHLVCSMLCFGSISEEFLCKLELSAEAVYEKIIPVLKIRYSDGVSFDLEELLWLELRCRC